MDVFTQTSWIDLGILVGFHLMVLFILVLDLGVLHRKDGTVSPTEAALWSAVWVILALAFAAGIWFLWPLWQPDEPEEGPRKSIEFLTGYLIEKSLSVDNLFVFLLIFRHFAVPKDLQHRVLVWGVVGALVLRALLIIAGAALLHHFSWIMYIFAAFLIYTGIRMLFSIEHDVDPEKNPLLRLVRRIWPISGTYNGKRFWIQQNGVWMLTPLPLVLLVVESTDVIFAVDSIPAIFAVTDDPFVVYTSNVFAIMGLRALYFLLASLIGKLRYLNLGLGLVLAFVGIKMLIHEWYKVPVTWSLLVVAVILTTATVFSLLARPRRTPALEGEPPTPPEVPVDQPATEDRSPWSISGRQ